MTGQSRICGQPATVAAAKSPPTTSQSRRFIDWG